MQKRFYIISIILLILVSATIAIPLTIIYKDYAKDALYYSFLTILIYLTMVIPLFSCVLIAIKEAKKIEPALPNGLNSAIFIFLSLGVLIFLLTTNFVGTKYFPTYGYFMWVCLVIDICLSIYLGYYLSRKKEDLNGPKFIKK